MFKFLVGFVVFAAWTLWARHVYICEIKHLCQQEVFVDASTGNAASLRISQTGEIIGGDEQFSFALAGSQPSMNVGNRYFLERMSKYLQPDNEQLLKIVGRYSEAEKNVPSGMYENLGLARAACIRDTLIEWYQVQPRRIWIDSERIEDTDSEAATAPEEAVAFWMGKEDMLLPTERYEFTNMTFSEANFRKNDTVFTPTLPFVIYADSLEKYAQQHPKHYIWIVSYARNAEAKKIAILRAEAVKKYLLRTKAIQVTIFTDTKMTTKQTTHKPCLNIQIYQAN